MQVNPAMFSPTTTLRSLLTIGLLLGGAGSALAIDTEAAAHAHAGARATVDASGAIATAHELRDDVQGRVGASHEAAVNTRGRVEASVESRVDQSSDAAMDHYDDGRATAVEARMCAQTEARTRVESAQRTEAQVEADASEKARAAQNASTQVRAGFFANLRANLHSTLDYVTGIVAGLRITTQTNADLQHNLSHDEGRIDASVNARLDGTTQAEVNLPPPPQVDASFAASASGAVRALA